MNVLCEGLSLCERVVEDKHTRLLSLFGWLEQIESPKFPSVHHGFAFAARFYWGDDNGPDGPSPCEVRLVREEEGEPDEDVWKATATWMPGTKRLRAYQNFGTLRLKRAGHLRFHVEFRAEGAAWQRGSTAYVDVTEKTLSAEQAAAMRKELARLGLSPPPWLTEPTPSGEGE